MTAVTAVPMALETIHILLKNSRWIPHLKLTCASCPIERLSKMTSRPLRTRLTWCASPHVLSSCKIAVAQDLAIKTRHWVGMYIQSPATSVFSWPLRASSQSPSHQARREMRWDQLQLTILDNGARGQKPIFAGLN